MKVLNDKIENQIEYLREVRENLKKYIAEHENDNEIKGVVMGCKGQIIEIKRNIDFLKSLLITIKNEKDRIIKLIEGENE